MTLILTATIRVGLGLLFFVSGASKVVRARSVARMVANYSLVPRSLLPLVTMILAPSELATGALMLLSVWLPVWPIACSLAITLLVGFSIAVWSALARGFDIPCGCGLLLNNHVIKQGTIVSNLVLLSLLAIDFLLQRSTHS